MLLWTCQRNLGLLAVEAGSRPDGDVGGETFQDKPRRHQAPEGEPPQMQNVVKMENNAFSEFLWDNGAKNAC
jgi:hypothetical protein